MHDQSFEAHPTTYYWSTFQSEWAIDIVFRTADDLRRVYPRLLQHAISTFSSSDVMRFLGRRIPLSGDIPKRFAGEVVSDLHARQEGVRVKHRLNSNSVKLYDTAFTSVGSVLRAEGTINDVSDFRIYRPKEGDPQGGLAWRPLRRGIADLHRRAEVGAKLPNATSTRWPAPNRTPPRTTSCVDSANPSTGTVDVSRALHPFAPG